MNRDRRSAEPDDQDVRYGREPADRDEEMFAADMGQPGRLHRVEFDEVGADGYSRKGADERVTVTGVLYPDGSTEVYTATLPSFIPLEELDPLEDEDGEA